MKPVTPQNNWILNKIAAFLGAKEGCIVDEMEYTDNGARVYIQDAFGYRYEVSIKTITRVSTPVPNTPEAQILENVTYLKVK